MQYSEYTVQDFIMDEYFQQWVLNPDKEVDNFWNSWIALHPDKEEVVEEAKDILKNFWFRKYEFTEDNFKEVWQQIKKENEKFNRKKNKYLFPKEGVTRYITNPFPIVAAAIALLMVFSAGFYFFNLSNKTSFKHYKTTFGETQSITLQDSSKVTLNANSFIRVKQNWGREQEPREVWVKGEAFFTIEHTNDNRKFIVHTDNIKVEVLGTSFNVNTRRDKTEVVLDQGKVKLSSNLLPNQGPLLMQPGELVAFSTKDNSFQQKMVDPEDYSAWRNNKLVFKDRPIQAIAGELEDNFGLEIVFKDSSITSHRFTGTIPMDQYEIFFTTITKTFGVAISKKGDKVIIGKNNSRNK